MISGYVEAPVGWMVHYLLAGDPEWYSWRVNTRQLSGLQHQHDNPVIDVQCAVYVTGTHVHTEHVYIDMCVYRHTHTHTHTHSEKPLNNAGL